MSPSRTASAVQVHQHDIATGTFDDGADRRPPDCAEDEVALRFGRSLGMSAGLSLGALTAD
jgi:hypothetical protein